LVSMRTNRLRKRGNEHVKRDLLLPNSRDHAGWRQSRSRPVRKHSYPDLTPPRILFEEKKTGKKNEQKRTKVTLASPRGKGKAYKLFAGEECPEGQAYMTCIHRMGPSKTRFRKNCPQRGPTRGGKQRVKDAGGTSPRYVKGPCGDPTSRKERTWGAGKRCGGKKGNQSSQKTTIIKKKRGGCQPSNPPQRPTSSGEKRLEKRPLQAQDVTRTLPG